MAGFLYYLPGLHAAGRREIAAAGLGYAFEESPATVRVSSGPDGTGGVVLGVERSLSTAVGFYPDAQTWRKIPGESAWIGLASGSILPGPADLTRHEQLKGHWVKLADGEEWLVPIARQWSEDDDGELRWSHALPRTLDLDESGEWTFTKILPRYAPLWEIAERWEEARQRAIVGESDEAGNVPVKLTFANAIDSAVSALQINYRVSRIECAMAGLLAGGIPSDVLDAVIDWPTRLEWFKKKLATAELDGGPTGDGLPD